MIGIASLFYFMLMGVLLMWRIFGGAARAIKVWLGLTAGLVMMMWLPSGVAFMTGFTLTAQYIAIGAAALIAAAPWCAALISRLLKREQPARLTHVSSNQHPPLAVTLALVIPFTILAAYLLHTHTINNVAGDFHVGQSTYGDLSLHLGIATGLRNASYPPEYTLLPGTLLGYPFLADALASTMLMLGASLRNSFLISAIAMMALVFWGFTIIAWRMTKDARATVLAFLLMFLNGGLGFIYILDGATSDPSRLREVFDGFYMTPTNMPDLNLRWSNVLCDMMIPQRTLLAGWVMLIPAIYMLMDLLKAKRRKIAVVIGIWAGLMPMVHTHSFLALGFLSAGALIYALIRSERGRIMDWLANFILYGAIAVAIALPQLLIWTFPQTIGGNSIKFIFNWVNWSDSTGGLIDPYLWFWIKNVGLVFIIMVPAAIYGTPRLKALSAGALTIFVIAETMRFQPNTYDNNKLFYVAYMVMVPVCARYLVAIFDKLRHIPGRRLLAGAFILVSCLSAALTVGRELVSDYVLFDSASVEAAEYIEANANADAVFATATNHNNAVASLTGRKLVCGTPTFLYYHGVDYSEHQRAVKMMYEQPDQSAALFKQYGVDYLFLSGWEYGEFIVDVDALDRLFEVWYENNGITIYRIDSAT